MASENDRAHAIELARRVNDACMKLVKRVNQAADDAYDVLRPDVLANAFEQAFTDLYVLSIGRQLTADQQASILITSYEKSFDTIDRKFPLRPRSSAMGTS